MTTPRDAFITALCKASLPPHYTLTVLNSQSIAMSAQKGWFYLNSQSIAMSAQKGWFYLNSQSIAMSVQKGWFYLNSHSFS
jgi:hypothetical protein